MSEKDRNQKQMPQVLSVNGENPVPQWYVAVKGERIIGGLCRMYVHREKGRKKVTNTQSDSRK